jgi:hypothetical protein
VKTIIPDTPARPYAEIPTGRGFALRVSRSVFRGRHRVDVRHLFEVRPGDPDTRQPTKKGANVPIDLLPQLRAALQAIEADALREGLLEPEDYTDNGLALPEELTR